MTRRRLITLGIAVLGALIVIRVGLVVARSNSTAAPMAEAQSTIEVPPPALAAHGVVQPIARARVASVGSGTVAELTVNVGQTVNQGQVVARIAGQTQSEMVVAPWRGTVTNVASRVGDTVVPGTALLSMADDSRYQVETTDADGYVVSRVRPGQMARVTFDGLEGRSVRASVKSVAAQPETIASGGAHYPVVIELAGAAPELRAGMTVHVLFEQ